MSMRHEGGTKYDEPRLLRMFRLSMRWCRSNLADIGVYLATALYGLSYGTQHLASHILIHIWLRYTIVRWITGTLLAISACFLLITLTVLWVTWRPLTAADMFPLAGTVAAFGRNQDDQRLIIDLAEYGSPFLLPASSAPFFNERDFLRDVHAGDRITISIDRHLQDYLPKHKLLVAHEIQARGVTYLALQPVQASRQHDIFQTGPLLAIVVLIILACYVVWFKRTTRKA